jgi:uncharacterized protein
LKETLLSDNGLSVAGLVVASFAAALASGRFAPALPSWAQVGRACSEGR